MGSTGVGAASLPAGKGVPSFALVMTILMTLFVFGGFGLHSALPAMQGQFPPAPPIVHIHAVLSATWMLLLVVQASLVNAGNLRLHRSLGTFGIAHATAVLIIGLFIQLIASRKGMDAGRDPGTDGLYLGLLAFIGFGIMFILAIRNVKRPQVHKRMILLGMLPVLPPGVNRFWAEALSLDDPIPTLHLYATLWTMAAAVLVQERRETGRISGYSLFGAGWIVAEGIAHEWVVGSPWFSQLSGAILGLAHYR